MKTIGSFLVLLFNKRLLFLLPLICLLHFTASTQTASVEKGCLPLVVEFGAPNTSGNYWNFDDGTSSVLQNPVHTFINPGQYEVELRAGLGGAIIGTVTITVYADPILEVEASIYSDCGPLEVDFTPLITLDPALTIESISWSFGDGFASTELNPTHTYTGSGMYSVSLEVTTNETACNKTEIFEELITVESIGFVGFSLNFDQTSACDLPAVVKINNNSFQLPGVIYSWDFGNETTSLEEEPSSISYNEVGTYEIALTVTTSFGCEEIYTDSFTIGSTPFDILFPDTVCYKTDFSIGNNTPIDSFLWIFGPNASRDSSFSKEPTNSYAEGGLQTIQLQGIDIDDCPIDTSFQIFVQEPNSDFSITPTQGCIDPAIVVATADAQDYETYIWNESFTTSPQFEFEIVCPLGDSLTINTRDSILLSLAVITELGCTKTTRLGYINRKPYAHFLPSVTQGCAPLSVLFADISESLNGFENTFWDLGDGTTATNQTVITHVYNQPGSYYTQLIVETSEGCRDTSAGRWIHVGEQITPLYSISDTDICLDESIEINLLNDDPRIDGWHVYTDDARTGHCFIEPSMTHQFTTSPGVYDVEFSVNYNGCFTEFIAPEQITVGGAKADISYMINCDSPYDLMLKSDDFHANQVTWLIDDEEISTEDSLMYSFDERGKYIVTLIAEDAGSGCPADTSEVEIFITDPVAAFEFPDQICDNIKYDFDASASIDVDAECGQGYLWKLPTSRPREVDTSIIQNVISESGIHDISLIVEDVHGCRDTLTRTTEVFEINADMFADTYNTCTPDSITFVNLSTSDTTLVNTEWSFGASGDLATFYIESIFVDQYDFSLALEDAIGCKDTITQSIVFYDPISSLEPSQEPYVCVGDEITFTATDFTSEGSFLNITWDFGDGQTDTGSEVTHVFNTLGAHQVQMFYEEDATGCGGRRTKLMSVLPLPNALFESSLDTIDQICAPAQIELTNFSTYFGALTHGWYIDGDGPFDGDTTTFAFDKGTHTVELIVESIWGCTDTFSNNYTLIGPEANIIVTPENLCLEEEATFSLTDMVDVSRWEWDFGDGSIASNGNPATHTYAFIPTTETTNVTVTLFSEETGCEQIETLPVEFVEPEAIFELKDTLMYCDGTAFFNNLSTNANEFTWSHNGQVFSNEESPRFDFGMNGDYEVTLNASIVGQTCFSEYTQSITLNPISGIVELPNVFTPNGDGTNDFFGPVTSPEFEDLVNVLTFKIYDRWGQLIYDNENPQMGWDGNFNNNEAPSAVYAYFIEYELIECNIEVKKGNVTIIR